MPTKTYLRSVALVLFAALTFPATPARAAEPQILNLWPGTPPGGTNSLPPEMDRTKPTDRLIAGRRIVRLTNVSTPQLAVYRPSKANDNGAAVIICPGGGFNVLAYDLEGTEVADWLNSLGFTAIVLKYRVPFRDPNKRWLAAVQDAQRAMSVTRSHAREWNLDPERIGILGFSAGGVTAAYTALLGDQRQYDPIDAKEEFSARPDFILLIYTGGFVDRGETQFKSPFPVPKNAPPAFLVHAFDDAVPVENALLFAAEYRKLGASAELHVYDTGGHGYGMRPVASLPVTSWPKRAEEWLARRGLLKPAN